ncbi:MAG: indolepyruvate oxidoreductase subunit beta [Candidatus Methanomethylicia archaeon]
MSLNIVIAGVGGQGLLTFASILASAVLRRNIKVLVAETHGLSQRGGSVRVHVRIGDVDAPLVPRRLADAIVALELIEAIRSIEYANKNTVIVANKQIRRPPLPGVKAPSIDEVLNMFREFKLKNYIVDAEEIALKAGSSLSTNMVMLGALLKTGVLSKLLDIQDVEEVIKSMGGPWIEVNLRALRKGYEAI